MERRSKQREEQALMSNELVRTASLVPDNLRRAAAAENPIIQVVYNVLQRFRSQNGSNFENIITLVALYKVVSPAWRRLKALFLRFFTSQVTILESDPAGQEVIQWMSAEIFGAGINTSAMIATGGQQGQGYLNDVMGSGALDAHVDRMDSLLSIASNRRSKGRIGDAPVQCLPHVGTKLFWVGYRPFLYYRSGNQQSPFQSADRRSGGPLLASNIVLYTPGWSLKPLLNFVEKCHQHTAQKMIGSIVIHYAAGARQTWDGSLWSRITKPKRKLDTVDLDEDLKTKLVNDAVYYCSEESKKFYADCGIPYRRGYLFYGPPGTGKTSFSAALAGHLDCNLYIISLSSGDTGDEGLRRLFMTLPTRCVVVIEDIDSCGIGREEVSKPKPHASKGLSGREGPPPRMPFAHPDSLSSAGRGRNLLSLSGVLNAIDGNASAEGRLLILTSNNPDSLDEALIRPGRIDMKFHFGKMKKRAIHDMFKRLVGRAAIATKGFSEGEIEDYAETFAAKVPSETFTPAQLQNFLQDCRGDPVKVVAEIDTWVKVDRSVVVEKPATVSVAATTPSVDSEEALSEIDMEDVQALLHRSEEGELGMV